MGIGTEDLDDFLKDVLGLDVAVIVHKELQYVMRVQKKMIKHLWRSGNGVG